MEIERKDLRLAVGCFAIFLFGFIGGTAQGYFYSEDKALEAYRIGLDYGFEASNPSPNLWDDINRCDLILEQRVACYKGCGHYDNYQEEYYNLCLIYCQNHYYVEFGLDGDTYLDCQYWKEAPAVTPDEGNDMTKAPDKGKSPTQGEKND